MFSYSTAMIPGRIDLPNGRLGVLWPYKNTGRQGVLHRHDELELNYVLRGQAVCLAGDRSYPLTPRTLVWLFPEQAHLLSEKSPDLAMWIGVFSSELIEFACRTGNTAVLRQTDPAGQFCRRLMPAQEELILKIFAQVAAVPEESVDEINTGLAYALTAAWRAFQEADEIPASFELHPAVERVLHLLDTEPEPLTNPEIAERVGLSTSRLAAVFKAETGMTLVDFRNRRLVDRYLRLYGRGRTHSMLRAALDAGFGSYVQFYRVFRQVVGCSPREYHRRGK